jgi:ribose transport system permease protein
VRQVKRSKNVIGVVIAWVVIYAIFSALKPQNFLNPSNIELMVRQSIVDGLGAIGMTYVIISGGIDLSAGSVIALSTVVGALTLKATGRPELALAAATLSGVLSGFINGLTITKLKVGPFIVTLASMLAIRGLAKGLANEQTVGGVPDSWLRQLTSALGPGEHWLLIPKGAWLWFVLLLGAAWALQFTVFGRNTVAIGSSEATARLCGIKIGLTKTMIYTIAGFFFGLAGLMELSRTTIGDPTIAGGEELKMIAAAVIGGASLSGGQGSVIGAAFGTLIMTTINMGCTQMGVPNWIQEILTGVIIIVAVALDRWRLSRAGSGPA